MTEHIFSPATNKQTNNGKKKTKKQINKLRGTSGRGCSTKNDERPCHLGV